MNTREIPLVLFDHLAIGKQKLPNGKLFGVWLRPYGVLYFVLSEHNTGFSVGVSSSVELIGNACAFCVVQSGIDQRQSKTDETGTTYPITADVLVRHPATTEEQNVVAELKERVLGLTRVAEPIAVTETFEEQVQLLG